MNLPDLHMSPTAAQLWRHRMLLGILNRRLALNPTDGLAAEQRETLLWNIVEIKINDLEELSELQDIAKEISEWDFMIRDAEYEIMRHLCESRQELMDRKTSIEAV